MVISINRAEYLGDYRIKLWFSDGKEKEVDFGIFLRNARNPMARKYIDKKLFSNFRIEYGDVIWNDYELCFPIWDLYEGTV